jgi:hypothetical protein
VGLRSFFSVLWSDKLEDTVGNKLYGMTMFTPKQIVINSDQSDKEAVHTTFHEAIHAWDDEHEIGLTEPQVIKLEKCFPYIRELILTLEAKNKNKA